MQFPPRPYNNCVPTIVLCKYLLAIALVRIVDLIVYYLSLCKIVTKVNYNIFQSQPFRMWRSHAATTELRHVPSLLPSSPEWPPAGAVRV